MRKAEISIALQNLGILFGVGGLRAWLADRLAGVAPVIVRFDGKPPRRSVKIMKRVRSAAEVAYGSTGDIARALLWTIF